MMGRKVLEVLRYNIKNSIMVHLCLCIDYHLWSPFLHIIARFTVLDKFFFAVKGLEAANYDLKSKTKELLQDLTLPLHLPRKIMKYMAVS